MNTSATIQSLLNKGINFVFAPQDSTANDFSALLNDSTYHAATREAAQADIEAMNQGTGYTGTTWIWDLKEELANAVN